MTKLIQHGGLLGHETYSGQHVQMQPVVLATDQEEQVGGMPVEQRTSRASRLASRSLALFKSPVVPASATNSCKIEDLVLPGKSGAMKPGWIISGNRV